MQTAVPQALANAMRSTVASLAMLFFCVGRSHGDTFFHGDTFPKLQNIQRIRNATGLSLQPYLDASQPVILEGAINSWPILDWGVRGGGVVQAISQRCGHRPLDVPPCADRHRQKSFAKRWNSDLQGSAWGGMEQAKADPDARVSDVLDDPKDTRYVTLGQSHCHELLG